MNALTQSAIGHALKIGGPEVERRRLSVIEQRTRLLDALRDMPVEPCDSQANFVWLKARDLSGLELAGRLRREGCSWPRAARWAPPTMCGSRCATRPPRIVCWRRWRRRWAPAAL